MNQIAKTLTESRILFLNIKLCKRFAGHSKWSNIKHDKEKQDKMRSKMYMQFLNRMKVAVIEGGSPKPSHNSRLASIINEAKQINMPSSTINAFLERMETKSDVESTVEIRGLGGWILAVHVMPYKNDTRPALKKLLKKFNVSCSELGRNVFYTKGIIKTRAKSTVDKAMEDALELGMEDVEEFIENGSNCFMFKCDVQLLLKMESQLESRNYTIISAEKELIPYHVVELSETDKEVVDKVYEILSSMSSVVKIYNNIASM